MFVKPRRHRKRRAPAPGVSRLLQAGAGAHEKAAIPGAGNRGLPGHLPVADPVRAQAAEPAAACALAARLANTPSSQSLRMTGTAVTSCSV